MTTNNDKNAVGGWGGFVYFRALLRPAQAGTAFRGGVFAQPAQAGTDANGLSHVLMFAKIFPFITLKSISHSH